MLAAEAADTLRFSRRRTKNNSSNKGSNMDMIDEFVDVDADLQKVYNQWTQFEDFPEFMEGVEKVKQLDDKHVHWVAKLGGYQEEWDTEIYEQIPDLMIAWRSAGGRFNEGHVRFERLSIDQTRVHVQFVYETESGKERMANVRGMISASVKRELKRFKLFIESRPQETGAWRGIIHGSRVNRERVRGMYTRSQRLRKHNRLSSLKPPIL
jgi:uncharacterized membrane protein